MALSTQTQREGPVALIGQPLGGAGLGWKLLLLPSRLPAAGGRGWGLVGAAGGGGGEVGSRQVSPCLFILLSGEQPYRLGYWLLEIPQICDASCIAVQKLNPTGHSG